MGSFDQEFADLLPKDSGKDFSADFSDLLPKDTGRDFSADFADLAPAPSAKLPAVQADVRKAEQPPIDRPARMTLTRGGQSVLVPDTEATFTREAPWSAVVQSLPAQLVAGAESTGANLREMLSKNSIQFLKDEIARKDASPEERAYNEAVLAAAEGRLPEKVAASKKAREIAAAVTPPDMTTMQKGVSSFVQSAPSTLAAVVTGVLTRSPQAAMAIGGLGGFVQQAGQTYGEAIVKGATHEVARRSSLIQGAIELFDAVPIGVAMKAGSPFMKRLGATLLTEPLTEGAQQALQDLEAYSSYDPNMTLGEAWENVQIAMVAGAIGAHVYTAGGHAIESSRTSAALGQVARDIEATDVTQGTREEAIARLHPDRAQYRAVEISTPSAAAQQEVLPAKPPVQAEPPPEPTAQVPAEAVQPARSAAPAQEVVAEEAQPTAAPNATGDALNTGFKVAMRLADGRVFIAKEGEATHGQMYARLRDEGVIDQEKSLEARYNLDVEPGFTDPSGKFLTRDEAYEASNIYGSEDLGEQEHTGAFATKADAKAAARRQASEFKLPFKAVPHPTEDGAWAVEQVVRSEAQQAADRRTAARARNRLKPDESRDTITTFIAKLGGLRLDESPDLLGERQALRAPNHPMLFLVRRKGGMGIDAMGEYLVEAGYFAERPTEEEIRAAITAELDGKNQYSFHGTEAQADAAKRDQELQNEAVAFAEDAGIPELEQVSSAEEVVQHHKFVPSSETELTGPRLALMELTQRAAELDEGAVERLAMQFEGNDAEYAAALQEVINANEQDVAGRDRGVGEAIEPFALAGETEVERQARESGERDRVGRERQEADERDARDRADRERGDFALTGSERAADANPNQDAMFSPEGWDVADTRNEDAQRTWTQISESVAALAQKITPTVNVKTVLSIWGAPEGFRPAGRHSGPRNLIEVALTTANPERIFRHEAIHALRDMGLFTPQEWRMLDAQARKTWRTEFAVADRWGGLNLTDEQLREEAVAEAFASFKEGTLTAQPPIQKVMRKIADFIQRLGNLLRGMGFQTVEDIFAKVESGEVGRRMGELAGASPDGIAYSVGPTPPNQAAPAVQQNYVVGAQRALRQQMTNPPPNAWESDAGLLKRLIVTPRTIAVFDQDFVPVYQTAVEQWKFRDQLIAKFERAAEPYFKATQADQAVVNKILEHDRLTGQIGLAGQNMTVHFTSPEAQLTRAGERLTVTDDQKRAYWAVRNMLNEALNEFRDQTLEDFNLPRGTTAAQVNQQAAQATVRAEATRLTKIAEILQGIEDARRTGYVPFSRYGEVGISVRNALTGTLTHYETVEVGMLGKKNGRAIAEIPEVKARLAALRAKYPGQTIAEPFQVPKAGMPPQVKLEEVDALAEMAKIDNATWDSVRAKLEQAVAGQGFRAHFFRAKNTPGYSADFERGLANYVNGISGYLARRRYAPQWVAAIAPISQNKSKLRQYAQDYQKYVNSPAEEFGFLRSVNFIYYLTSLATWITNLTQVPFVSMPWTTQFANPVAITAAYTRAAAETAAMLTVKNGTQLYSASKAPADVRQAVQEAYDQGLFIPITTYESMGIARNQGRRLRNLSKGGQLAIELFGLGFTMAERQNRISTFIALYRLARDNPALKVNFARVMANNAMGRDLLAHWSPESFAEFGIDDTHFKSGKVNRQMLGRNAGTLVFQFKMFNLNVLERIITMTALQGSEGRAAAALMMMVLGAMAGVWGLPGADNLKDLYELYVKKVKNREVNADAEMRKIIVELTGSAMAAQVASGGVTRALPEPWTIDLSQRVGMGRIIPNEPGAMAGVTYDLWFKRPMQAMEQFEVDNFLLGIAELSPKQAADFMTQLAWSKQGVRTKASDQPIIPPEKVTPGMRLQKAVGFTPGTVANVREAERAEQVAKSAANEARTDFYRRMSKVVAEEVRAEKAGDVVAGAKADMAEEVIWTEIDKWNKANPEDYLQVRLDRKTAKTNLVKEFEGADYDKGTRKQARGEVDKLRQVYGR